MDCIVKLKGKQMYHVALIGPDGHVAWDKFRTRIAAECNAIRWTAGQNNWAEIYRDNKLICTVRKGVVTK